jgi:hypothetical protein
MRRLKHYLYANLYFLLPALLVIVLFSPFYWRFTNLVRPSVYRTEPACDFKGGGGSLNICENEVWWRAIVLAFAVSNFLAWLVSQVVIWRLRIDWLSPLYGLAFFYGLLLALLFLNSILSGVLSDYSQRIEDVWLKLDIVIGLGLALPLSWVNFKRYIQKEARQAATMQL